MKLSTALRGAFAAARANLMPGLLLQFLMLLFLIAYETHDGTRHFLAEVGKVKQEAGYLFAFTSYVLSAALLPELLIIAFFQRGRVTRKNVWNFFTAAPAWGLTGVLVDFFYRCQVLWLGAGNDLFTVFAKMFVDQFIFSPFLCTPLIVIYYLWRDNGFKASKLHRYANWNFWPNRVLPVQAAGWCIWIPGVCLIYFMPSDLQIPIAALIEAFWVLVFTVVHRPAAH